MTDRRLAENNNEAIYKIIFDHALDGIILGDIESKKFLLCNSAICTMLGYNEDELLKLWVTDIHPEKDLPYVMEQFEKQARNISTIAKNIPVQRKDGTVFYVDINTSSLTIDGRPCLLGMFRDVSERRQVEEALRESAVQLQIHIDNSFDVIFTLNAEGVFTFVSDAWERHFGYPVSEVLGKSFVPLVHPDDIAPCLEYLQRVMVSMQPATSPPYRVRHADGSWRTFIANGMPYFDDSGELLFNGVGHDITKRQQLEEEIQEALVIAEAGLKVRSEFLANITHELVTPLNSVIGFSQVLLDGLSGLLNEKQQKYVQAILQNGQRLNETYGDLLQIAELGSGEIQIQVGRFRLKDLLESSIQHLGKKALTQGVTLSLEIGSLPETEIEADRAKLLQVLFNLLDNAVKFTPAGGSVQVSARRISDGDYIEISVTDTGIGVKEEDMGRLFKPFQQLESPYTKKYKGTGLGLLLAKKLVELHGGSIRAESEFGKGSTFTFVIPVGS